MNLLVIGGGGREHALVWKLAQSPRVTKIIVSPGNAGIEALAECVPVRAEDLAGQLQLARERKIDLTVVGPDYPLAEGIVDLFEKNGLQIFGPSAAAARLESSKVFSKQILQKYKLPTARARSFSDPSAALAFAQTLSLPVVIKADGLALGKGVIIAQNEQQVREALDCLLVKKIFGKAGERILIEEFLEGQELSIHCFGDGKRLVMMPPSQDHKRVWDGDAGPNTGGMGAYCPVPQVDESLLERIEQEILQPLLQGLSKECLKYQGVLYPGLMLTKQGPKVLEFNARFGDPETQVLLPRMENDLVDVMEACLDGRLDQITLRWRKEAAVCVVMTSGGYPGDYEKDKCIEGLPDAAQFDNVHVFHAGTRREGKKIVTNGGRVLGITALGSTLAEAQARAYEAVATIRFAGAHYRRDIAAKAL